MNETFTVATEQAESMFSSYEAITIALALNAIGFVISKTPLDNRWIPLILLVLGTVAYSSWLGWTVEHIIVGIVVGASPVGFNQFVRQTFSSQPSTPAATTTNEKPNP